MVCAISLIPLRRQTTPFNSHAARFRSHRLPSSAQSRVKDAATLLAASMDANLQAHTSHYPLLLARFARRGLVPESRARSPVVFAVAYTRTQRPLVALTSAFAVPVRHALKLRLRPTVLGHNVVTVGAFLRAVRSRYLPCFRTAPS